MNSFDLSGKVALVTGAARGLGRDLAVGLAQAGADIVAVSNRTPLDATLSDIRQLGRNAVGMQADLSNESQLSCLVEEALLRFARIDILVNNSGIIRRESAAGHPWSDWHDVLTLNLNSVFFLCQLVGNKMIEQGSGKIINIASMLSFQGGINVPGYTASKHGVAGITKALANEWASKGIQVNAIAPGYMATDNTEALRQDEIRSKQILERIPAGRWGSPKDLRGPVVFLASSASDYVNGHVLTVDGGWLVR